MTNPKTHKIVVIDDSMVIRRTVKDMLPEGSFEVLEAKDGLEGFNLICTENPTLIMLDFILPKMTGWEIYQEIQKQQKLKSIPLVLMSGRKDEVTSKISEPFEYFSFLEKPFDQKQLHAGIKDAMLKSKKQPKVEPVAAIATSGDSDLSAMSNEINNLKETIVKMQLEIDTLKKQLNKVFQFIQQKLK